MTSAILQTRPQSIVARVIAAFFQREPLFAGAALCLIVLVLPTLAAMALDQRTLLGINVWIKPLKFEFALIVYLCTLAWFAGWLPQGVVATRRYRLFALAVVLSITGEMIWICGAAAHGVASHFNISSLLMAMAYQIMGGLAVLLTSASLVYGILILRDRNSRLDPAFRWSVGIGLIATFVLTLVSAGFMASGASHFVGGSQSDATGLPVLGWARDGGDLRVAHFFATHAMHVIPVFGFVAAALLPMRRSIAAISGFSTLYAAFTIYAFVEALAGRPFLTLPF